MSESGAKMIATACPGCIIQLQDVINHAGLKVNAVHILDLVSEALDKHKEDYTNSGIDAASKSSTNRKKE